MSSFQILGPISPVPMMVHAMRKYLGRVRVGVRVRVRFKVRV